MATKDDVSIDFRALTQASGTMRASQRALLKVAERSIEDGEWATAMDLFGRLSRQSAASQQFRDLIEGATTQLQERVEAPTKKSKKRSKKKQAEPDELPSDDEFEVLQDDYPTMMGRDEFSMAPNEQIRIVDSHLAGLEIEGLRAENIDLNVEFERLSSEITSKLQDVIADRFGPAPDQPYELPQTPVPAGLDHLLRDNSDELDALPGSDIDVARLLNNLQIYQPDQLEETQSSSPSDDVDPDASIREIVDYQKQRPPVDAVDILSKIDNLVDRYGAEERYRSMQLPTSRFNLDLPSIEPRALQSSVKSQLNLAELEQAAQAQAAQAQQEAAAAMDFDALAGGAAAESVEAPQVPVDEAALADLQQDYQSQRGDHDVDLGQMLNTIGSLASSQQATSESLSQLAKNQGPDTPIADGMLDSLTGLGNLPETPEAPMSEEQQRVSEHKLRLESVLTKFLADAGEKMIGEEPGEGQDSSFDLERAMRAAEEGAEQAAADLAEAEAAQAAAAAQASEATPPISATEGFAQIGEAIVTARETKEEEYLDVAEDKVEEIQERVETARVRIEALQRRLDDARSRIGDVRDYILGKEPSDDEAEGETQKVELSGESEIKATISADKIEAKVAAEAENETEAEESEEEAEAETDEAAEAETEVEAEAEAEPEEAALESTDEEEAEAEDEEDPQAKLMESLQEATDRLNQASDEAEEENLEGPGLSDEESYFMADEEFVQNRMAEKKNESPFQYGLRPQDMVDVTQAEDDQPVFEFDEFNDDDYESLTYDDSVDMAGTKVAEALKQNLPNIDPAFWPSAYVPYREFENRDGFFKDLQGDDVILPGEKEVRREGADEERESAVTAFDENRTDDLTDEEREDMLKGDELLASRRKKGGGLPKSMDLTYDFKYMFTNPSYRKYKTILNEAAQLVSEKRLDEALEYYYVVRDQNIPPAFRLMIEQNIRDITEAITRTFAHSDTIVSVNERGDVRRLKAVDNLDDVSETAQAS